MVWRRVGGVEVLAQNAAGRRSRSAAGRQRRSATQPQSLDHLLVTVGVRALQIVELAAALADHDQEAAPRMEILGMAGQVIGQVLYALAQDRDLHFGRSRIALLAGVFLDELLLALKRDRHRVSPNGSKV